MTELDRIDVNSGTSGNCDNDHPAGTIADLQSGQVQIRTQELIVDQARDEQEAAIPGDDGIRKNCNSVDLERNTESGIGGFDLGTKTDNVDLRIDDNEKIPIESGIVLMENRKETLAEKASVGLCGKVMIDKEVEKEIFDEPKLEMADSRGVNPSYVKDSDDNLHCEDSCKRGHVIEDGNGDGSSKQDMEADAKRENPENLMGVEFVGMGLKPHVKKDENVSDDIKMPGDVKAAFEDSDLVWAKVRSHPWWPGQIFDASSASEKAKKYFKKGSFLVAYFGDHTFAWNDASRIKPFWRHFSQMERQTRLGDFCNAVDCALEEVSRRIEFGLACPCVSKEVYNKIKTQIIINPGIREDSCEGDGGHSSSSAKSFEPTKLVEYMRSLACSPSYHVADKLKFVTQRAQLLAFHRWKGYPDLPRFETLHGSLESASQKSTPGEKRKKTPEGTVSVGKTKTVEQVPSKRRKSEDNKDSSQKPGRKQRHGSEDKTARSRMEKTLSEFIAEKRLSENSVSSSVDKSGGRLVSDKKRKIEYSESQSSPVKIQKNMEHPMSQNPAKNDRKNNSLGGDMPKVRTTKPVFSVGASILKVASLMSSACPIIRKPGDGSSRKKAPVDKIKEKSLFRETQSEELAQTEKSSPDERLLRDSASENPKKKPSSFSDELEEFLKQASSGNIHKESAKLGTLESRDMEDTTEEPSPDRE